MTQGTDRWTKTERGFESRRYEVVLEGPANWALFVSGRRHSRYETASRARREAERLERLRVKRSELLRFGLGLVAVIALIAVVAWQRYGPNPEFQAAEELVTELDTAYGGIVGGSASVVGFTGPAVRGERFVLDNGEGLDVLLGQSGTSCYVMYWSPTRELHMRALDMRNAVPCTARAVFDIWNPDWKEAPTDWDPVLPPKTQERFWFLPAVAVLVGAGLSVLWRFIVVAARSVSG